MRVMTYPAWAVLAAVLVAAGCTSAPLYREHPQPDPVIKGELTPEKLEKALRMKVMRRLEYLNENRDDFQAQVVRTRIKGQNYFFRFYDYFPGDWHDVQIEMHDQTESEEPQVVPYEATVRYPRVRYETLYAGSADRIQTTDTFVRDEGLAKERYAFNGMTWELQDSFFDVKRTSVYRDNEWVPVQQRIRRVEQKQPEYFVDKIKNLFGFLGR